MKIFGIHFAPICIPLHRRIETLAAFTVLIMYSLSMFVAILISFLLLLSPFWPLMCMYIVWIVIDFKTVREKGRPIKCIQNLKIFKYARNYYPASLTMESNVVLDPKRNYMFCAFPHGLIPMGLLLTLGHNTPERKAFLANHSARVVALKIGFLVPFFRELVIGTGFITSDRESIGNYLKSSDGGKAVLIFVGGVSETHYGFDGQYCIILKNRKGFVKLALENGTPIVPIFSFGETSLYSKVNFSEGSLIYRFQKWLKEKSPLLALNVIYGRGFFQYNFGLVPYRHPLNVVVGNPIDVAKKENPTTEDIEALHSKFVQALTELFEEYKYKFEKEPAKKFLTIL